MAQNKQETERCHYCGKEILRGAYLCDACAHEIDRKQLEAEERDEPETEQCGRCGALIPKGYGVCENCACDLRHEAEDYHKRMSEAYDRGEL